MELPNTVIGLIAFICVGSLGAMGWLVRFFMTYIQKKNANLERTTEKFLAHLKERDEKHERERTDMESRLRDCLVSK